METPELPDRQIAAQLGVNHNTVTAQRKALKPGGESPHLNTVVGSDGKQYSTGSKASTEEKIRKTLKREPRKPTIEIAETYGVERPCPANNQTNFKEHDERDRSRTRLLE